MVYITVPILFNVCNHINAYTVNFILYILLLELLFTIINTIINIKGAVIMNIKKACLSLLSVIGILSPVTNVSASDLSYINSISETTPIILRHDAEVQHNKYLIDITGQDKDNVQSMYHYSHSSHGSHASHRSHYSSRY